MLIQINRAYRNGREEELILINTNWIISISPTKNREDELDDVDIDQLDYLPATRIIMAPQLGDTRVRVIYTNEPVSSIKGKYTKAINVRRKLED